YGGVAHLGYPASQRFSWGGFVTQITQKAVLQWRPDRGTIDFVNVFDDLGQIGKNDWLLTVCSIPPPVASNYDQGLDWPTIVVHRQELLRARPALLKAYFAVDDPLDLYGLPTSTVYDAGPMYVIRLQRAVLQEWKVKVPWANVGEVTVANGGDVAKEAGAFPWRQLRPAASPTDTWPTKSYAVNGVATWYGPGFAGKKMANGQIYLPSDPTTTAANAFPLGSTLRVTSGVTKKSIIVTVRDTGLFVYPDVTDLSPAAFAALGVPISAGVTAVTVELLPPPLAPPPTPTPTTSNTQAPPAR
ncbi:MAG TPA: septal ring lytic transglycosylase RlpA family protein, partial [Chloroflexota bacterium]|nr:septal ring lytic transglycosylase RlpA family protein [Chloroflexota bacterium]